jgi:hypothetical protein
VQRWEVLHETESQQRFICLEEILIKWDDAKSVEHLFEGMGIANFEEVPQNLWLCNRGRL